jgi:para-aminobenzoate synthetase
MSPEGLFADLAAKHRRMFWLDGGGARDWSGRRSLVGFLGEDDISLTYHAATREVRRHTEHSVEVVGDDVFTSLEEEIARDHGDPEVSWVGYFGYACRPDLPATTGAAAPDSVWMRVRNPMIFDHTAPARPGSRPAMTGHGPDTSGEAWYAAAYDRIQTQLRLGNTYEVNLTYREQIESATDPVTAYLRLRETSPAPYAGYLQHDGTSLLSSSPERFATIDRDRWVETRPIKGTTPRGDTEAEDEEHRRSLGTERRYRAENLMIVDLLRNDLSMVCEPGTVTVPELMHVESYANVHQLVSTVRGRLRPDIGTVGALRAIFPAGSMTGAPKLRTMEIIAEVEATPRGVYAGAFGWISADGRADLGVVIRSLVAIPSATATGHGYRYEFGTGGGITVHSDAASEFAETLWKSQRLHGVLD